MRSGTTDMRMREGTWAHRWFTGKSWAERRGGKTVMPPTEIPGYVTLAMFTDPAGNVTGLIKG